MVSLILNIFLFNTFAPTAMDCCVKEVLNYCQGLVLSGSKVSL